MTSPQDHPARFQRQRLRINGIHWDFIDEGQGPLALLLHGFPYLSYAFRYLIPGLISAGWRVVAPDLPGYGRSDCPEDVHRHTQIALTEDLSTLIHECGVNSAVLIGHDVGATLSYTTALVHPEVVSGLVLLNTPPQPRSTTPPREIWKTIREKTGSRFYQEYFTSEQAIVELNRDIRQTLLSTMYSISGSAIAAHRWRSLIGPSEGFLQTVHEPRQPPKWLSTTALGHYVSEYGRHGFGGALMPYRSREHSWKISAHLQGCHPPHAALFIGGALDPALERLEPALKALDKTLPQLRGREMLPGAGHNLPEEMPHETLKLMLPFMEMLVAQ